MGMGNDSYLRIEEAWGLGIWQSYLGYYQNRKMGIGLMVLAILLF